jgi:hypothetical protein
MYVKLLLARTEGEHGSYDLAEFVFIGTVECQVRGNESVLWSRATD